MNMRLSMDEVSMSESLGKAVLYDPNDAHALRNKHWYLTTQGYAESTSYKDGAATIVKMHRVILGLTPGDGLMVDHINGNKLDNRKGNLRIVTNGQNIMNSKLRKDNTSGQKGVTQKKTGPRKGRCLARIRFNNKRIALGFYKTFLEAKAARLAAERLYHGPYANKFI